MDTGVQIATTDDVHGQPSGVPTRNAAQVDASEIPTHNFRVRPARYVLLPLAQVLTGYTVKALERKIERGDWQEGKLWRRAPDGHITIDMEGYHKWVEGR